MDEIILRKGRYIYLSKYNQIINKEIKNLYLKYSKKRDIKFENIDINTIIIKRKVKNLKTIALEMTQNCNLRCKYCIYNENYLYQRKVTNKNLDFKTAKKVLDYIFSLVQNQKKRDFSFSFYGGEPLLNFKTIKDIVEYTKYLFFDWKLNFLITTNLTILDNKILEFLISNNFTILVSLDGPKKIQDSKRVFPDGSGSFNIVINNLKKIKFYNIKFYRKNVNFSVVYSKELPLLKIYDFFSKEKLVNENQLMFSYVSELDTNYYQKYIFNSNKVAYDLNTILGILKDKIKLKKKLNPFERFFYNHYTFKLKKIDIKQFTPLSGTCFFDHKLFIDANGRFHVCEKINEKFSIGDVENGYNFKKMKSILSEFCSEIKRKCYHCEYKFLCGICLIYMAKDGKIKLDSKFCKTQKENINYYLENAISLKESEAEV